MGPPEVMAKRGRRLERDQWGNIIGGDDRVSTFGALFRSLDDRLDPATLTDVQLSRLWRTLRFLDEPEGTFDTWGGPTVEVAIAQKYGQVQDERVPVPDRPDRMVPKARIITAAFERGIATRADLVDALVVPPHRGRHPGLVVARRDEVTDSLTAPRPERWAAGERTQAVVEEVRSAVIGHEERRGDLPTPLSPTARALRSAYGAASLVNVLAALGKQPFARGYAWNDSRDSGLSHLVRIHQPRPDDTPEELGRLVKAARISDRRLVETAVYGAPVVRAHRATPRLARPGVRRLVGARTHQGRQLGRGRADPGPVGQ